MDVLGFRKRKIFNNTKGFREHPLPWADAISNPDRADYRGVPTYVCPCGYDMFLVAAIFDGETQKPGMYLLDGICTHCGALVTVPCPVDGPDPLEVNDGVF